MKSIYEEPKIAILYMQPEKCISVSQGDDNIDMGGDTGGFDNGNG